MSLVNQAKGWMIGFGYYRWHCSLGNKNFRLSKSFLVSIGTTSEYGQFRD